MVSHCDVMFEFRLSCFPYLFSMLTILVMLSGSAYNIEPCGLPNASNKRMNVIDGKYNGSIGIVYGNWDSSKAIAEVTRILLEEMLGYNTSLHEGGTSSLKAFQMVANCEEPGETEPQCANPSLPPRHHIALEVWDIYKEQFANVTKLQKDMAPENHGSTGYDGMEGMYVLDQKMYEVYESTGLALSFYRSWNASWNNWSSYFARYTDISVSDLVACNDTTMNNKPKDWAEYVKYTNDTGGVERAGVNGTRVGKCEGGLSGQWWFGPACRMRPKSCIPLLTTGSGWGLRVLSQQVAAYNMPIALATASNYSTYLKWPLEHPMLMYRFRPDTAFVDLDPQLIIFPWTDRVAHYSGDRRTQNAACKTLKFTHYNFGAIAIRAHGLIAKMQISLQKMEEIMKLRIKGASVTEASCQWLKNNTDIWKPWIPDAITCPRGNGLVNGNGDFVTDREAASSCNDCECKDCEPGKASIRFADGVRVCKECEAGKSSEYASKQCHNCKAGRFASSAGSIWCEEASIGFHVPLPGATQSFPCAIGTFVATTGNFECANCSVGHFADANGTSECTRCPIGKFAMAPGQSDCVACSNPSTSTLGMGARDESECICKANMYRLGANAAGDCQPCPAQMSCEQGATERALKSFLQNGQTLLSPFGDFAEPYPVLIKGFWSAESDPFSIYRCWNDDKCPGGPPGSCAPDMDLTKRSCSHCRTNFYWNGRKCEECSAPDKSGFFFPGILILGAIAAIVFMYELFTDSMDRWNSWVNKCSVIAFLVFNHYQVLVLLGEANVELPESLSGSVNTWRFAQNVIRVFNLACAGYGEFHSLALAQSLTPIFFFICVLLVIGAYRIGLKVFKIQRMAVDLNRMQNVFFTVLFTYFIGIASMSIALFQCKENPNGDYSLSRDLNVLCFESDWYDVLVVAIFAVLLYCIAFGSLFAWVLWQIERTPSLLDDLDFQMRWKFLLNKFNPEIHWWPLVFLIRGVLLNLSFVVSSQGMRQMYFFLTVEIIYLLLTVWFMPWRFRMANGCSVFLDAAIVYLSTIPLVYADIDSDQERDLANFGMAISFLPLLMAAVTLTIVMLAEWRKCTTLIAKEEDAGEEVEELCRILARCLEIEPQETHQLIAGLGDLDRWYFKRARQALEARFLAVHIRQVSRAVLGTNSTKASRVSSSMTSLGQGCWVSSSTTDAASRMSSSTLGQLDQMSPFGTEQDSVQNEDSISPLTPLHMLRSVLKERRQMTQSLSNPTKSEDDMRFHIGKPEEESPIPEDPVEP